MAPPRFSLRLLVLSICALPSLQQQQGIPQPGVFYPNSFIPFRIHSSAPDPSLQQRQQTNRFQQSFQLDPFDHHGEPLRYQSPPPPQQQDKYRLFPFQNGESVFATTPSPAQRQRQQQFQQQPQFQIQHPTIGFPSFRDEQDHRAPQSVGLPSPGFPYFSQANPPTSGRGFGASILTQDPRSGKLHYTYSNQQRPPSESPRGFSLAGVGGPPESLTAAQPAQLGPPSAESEDGEEEEVALLPHIPSGFSVLPTPPEQPRVPLRAQQTGHEREPRLMLGFPAKPEEDVSGPTSFVDQNLDAEEEVVAQGGVGGGEGRKEEERGKGRREGSLRKKPGNREQPGTRGNRLLGEDGRREEGKGGRGGEGADKKEAPSERPRFGPGGRRFKSGSGVRRVRPKANREEVSSSPAPPSTFRPRNRFFNSQKRVQLPLLESASTEAPAANPPTTITAAPVTTFRPQYDAMEEHSTDGVDPEVSAKEEIDHTDEVNDRHSLEHEARSRYKPETEGKTHSEEGEVHSEEGEVHSEKSEDHSEEGEAHSEEGEALTEEGEAHSEEGEAHSEEGEAHSEEGEAHSEEGEAHSEEGEAHSEESEAHSEESEALTEESEVHSEEGETNSEEGETLTEEGETHSEEGEALTEEGGAHSENGEAHAEEVGAEVKGQESGSGEEAEESPSVEFPGRDATEVSPHEEATTATPTEKVEDESESYHVITMKPSGSLVSQENFKDFVDSADIDATDTTKAPASEDVGVTDESGTASVSVSKAVPMVTVSSAGRGEPEGTPPPVISVVTTKSVVGGVSTPPPPPYASTTEGWVIVASVQTSRSVSGARPSPLKERGSTPEEPTSRPSTSPLPETTPSSPSALSSTESIIDKLDRVQSELSSGFLTGGFRSKLRPLSVRGMTSVSEHTTSSTTTEGPSPQTAPPPPVFIRKFSPMNRPTTSSTRTTAAPTPTPRKIGGARRPSSGGSLIDSVQFEDDLSGLLPPGFKPRGGSKKRPSPTPTTTKAPERDADSVIGGKVAFKEVVSSLLPPGYDPSKSAEDKPSDERPQIHPSKTDPLAALLPPRYTLVPKNDSQMSSTTTAKPSALDAILSKIKFQDVSSLLPAGYKGTASEGGAVKPKSLDISSLLPKGYEPPTSLEVSPPKKDGGFDISSLLPPGFKQQQPPLGETSMGAGANGSFPSHPESVANASTTAAPSAEDHPRVVFPSRPGGRKPMRKTTARPSNNGPPQPKIMKGWPTRATTEFTGWPTQATTPLSVEKILEQARKANAAVAAANAAATNPPAPTEAPAAAAGPPSGDSPSAAAEDTSTSSTTTTTTAEPTTPGVCWERCELVGLIKLVGDGKNESGASATWTRELMNHHTKEWKDLADAVFNELDAVYSKSEGLRKWYKRVRIDGFREGSVVVDYVVELNEVARRVDTQELKRLFNDALGQAERVPLTEAEGSSAAQGRSLGGPSPVSRGRTREMEVRRLGKFLVDPEFTEFKILSDEQLFSRGRGRGSGGASTGEGEDSEESVPQWAVAVIVIGLASLVFIVGFGVTVIVNRQKNAKKRREQQATPLTDEILREMGKGQSIGGPGVGGSFGGHPASGGGSFGGGPGFDNYGADTDLEDLYDMDDVWNERSHEKKRPPSTSGGTKRPPSTTANSYAGSNGGVANGSRFRPPEAAGHYDSWRTEWNDYYFNAYYGGGLGGGAGAPASNGRRRATPDYDTNF